MDGVLGLVGLVEFVGFWMGCRPVVTAIETSLVVLDANDAPPASGFALLVDDVSYSQNGTPQNWNAVSDSLLWSPITGEVTTSLENSGSHHWLICAPDPVTPGRMRTSVMPVGLGDTCRLDVQVPYQVLLRLRQGAPLEPNWHIVLHQSGMEELVLHEVDQHGGHQFRGQLLTQAFPLRLQLRQSNDSNATWTTLGSTTVPYQGEQTVVVAEWSNFAYAEL